jgi:hypothetical protein
MVKTRRSSAPIFQSNPSYCERAKRSPAVIACRHLVNRNALAYDVPAQPRIAARPAWCGEAVRKGTGREQFSACADRSAMRIVTNFAAKKTGVVKVRSSEFHLN